MSGKAGGQGRRAEDDGGHEGEGDDPMHGRGL